jgi:hypothetical protein
MISVRLKQAIVTEHLQEQPPEKLGPPTKERYTAWYTPLVVEGTTVKAHVEPMAVVWEG